MLSSVVFPLPASGQCFKVCMLIGRQVDDCSDTAKLAGQVHIQRAHALFATLMCVCGCVLQRLVYYLTGP